MKNFEKFKTAEERSEAFRKFCTFIECKNCKLRKSSITTNCSFTWLDLEAEEEKPLPCPFCGGAVSKHERIGDPDVYIECKKCGYRSRYYYDMDSAIDEHNMFSKAVKEAKESEAKHD